MQFSESWLRSLVNPALDSEQLGHVLTMAGLEVEAIEPAASMFTEVVVGHVLTAERHPDADRLQVCRVDVGQAEPLQIVCGAANARAGLKTACALVGAVLPGDFKIKRAKVRGVESLGMLCSEKELGLADAADGIMELAAEAQPGQSIRTHLDLDDQLITLKLTPNRGDCLSIEGVAREVAAITGAAWTPVECTDPDVASGKVIAVRIDDTSACPTYAGRVIEGVNARAATPDWMKKRLLRSGLRSISAIVDITNYVLLELGQPMHAFDFDRLQGGIHVRHAVAGEQLALLNGDTVELRPDVLVIADDSAALAMAGIMGGMSTSVGDTTTTILLEAAHFSPASIAGRARRHGLSTDSSYRFERGVDPSLPLRAMARASQLVLEICGGQAGATVTSGPGANPPAPIAFRPEKVRRVLGIQVDDATIASSFARLGLGLEQAAGVWQVTPPPYRFDLNLDVDLVEEAARLVGYDNIPAVPPSGAAAMRLPVESSRSAFDVKNIMTSMGYQEVVTYSFISEEQATTIDPGKPMLRLLNPIASQMSVMRGSILPGLLATLRHNLNRGQDRLRIFEAGRCFEAADAGQQPLRLAALAYGSDQPEQWGVTTRALDFFDLKGDLEALLAPLPLTCVAGEHPALHPGQSARLRVGNVEAGWLGTLHPRLVQELDLPRAPILFEMDLEAVLQRPVPRHRGLSKLPAVRRDLAVLVADDVPAGDILATLKRDLPKRVTEISLFDLYQGKGVETGKKSLAFSILLQDTEKTLTDSQIEEAVSEVLQILTNNYSAVLRG